MRSWYILGYDKNEIEEKIILLKKYKNIVVKFGRYVPGQQAHYDKVLRSVHCEWQPIRRKDFLKRMKLF